MTDRKYDFDLPKTFPSWEVGMAPGMLQSKGIWVDLPVPFQWKIYNAAQNGESLTITKAELDSLSDTSWVAIKDALNL
jgi:hypothetical protein